VLKRNLRHNERGSLFVCLDRHVHELTRDEDMFRVGEDRAYLYSVGRLLNLDAEIVELARVRVRAAVS